MVDADKTCKGGCALKGIVKSKRFVKWFSWVVELLGAIVLLWLSRRSFAYIFEHNDLIGNREYAKHMDYLIHAKNEDGTSLLSGLMIYFLGVALPFGYGALWLHRLDKWFAIRRVQKKFDQDRVLLEQQFNHRVVNQLN